MTTVPLSALVVDDDRAVAKLLAAYLDRLGLAVTVVYDRAAAESQLDSGGVFHLLVTDLELDGWAPGEGFAVLERCRELQPACKRILVSGSAGTAIAELGRAHGGDLFVGKPFTFGQLASAVRSLLDV